jgi:hypothetical protein
LKCQSTQQAQIEISTTPSSVASGALRFLALEKTLINSDGYWTRASDYSIYLDEKGRFHIIPHDANETFAPPEGPPGGMGGPGGPGGRRGPMGPPPSRNVWVWWTGWARRRRPARSATRWWRTTADGSA